MPVACGDVSARTLILGVEEAHAVVTNVDMHRCVPRIMILVIPGRDCVHAVAPICQRDRQASCLCKRIGQRHPLLPLTPVGNQHARVFQPTARAQGAHRCTSITDDT